MDDRTNSVQSLEDCSAKHKDITLPDSVNVEMFKYDFWEKIEEARLQTDNSRDWQAYMNRMALREIQKTAPSIKYVLYGGKPWVSLLKAYMNLVCLVEQSDRERIDAKKTKKKRKEED